MTQSNNALSTNQIINHCINHFVNQNDKVEIDYLVMLAGPNQLVHIDRVVFFTFVVFFKNTKNPNKKTMNCSSAMIQYFMACFNHGAYFKHIPLNIVAQRP